MSSQYFPSHENTSNNIKVELDWLITQQKMMLKI